MFRNFSDSNTNNDELNAHKPLQKPIETNKKLIFTDIFSSVVALRTLKMCIYSIKCVCVILIIGCIFKYNNYMSITFYCRHSEH